MFDKYHPGYFGKVSSVMSISCAPVPPPAPPSLSLSARTDTSYGSKLEEVLINTSDGQVGMRYFNKRTNKYWNPIINLDKLWTLVGEEVCCAP